MALNTKYVENSGHIVGVSDRVDLTEQASQPAPFNPNEKQVGGSHYRAGFQHWDLVAYNHMGYFEAQITKYITRWKKKNGAQDVEKSCHYLEKLQSLLEAKVLEYPPARRIVKLDEFAGQNKLSLLERLIFQIVMSYTSKEELLALKGYLDLLLEQAHGEPLVK